ncbi:MAG: DUF3567 domain-containing protein [Candidatus Cloacimonetes bacterium]|nr:DUF3567 domain-containing protein [Candidatus Cloacimonadota bacterium]MCK9517088.1 DUF3567 domain-containing protein [Ottowia sp.]
MMTLYDSESFAVVQLVLPAPASAEPDTDEAFARGFEILDKRVGKGLFLDGLWADMFQARIAAWQKDMPTQEEVESTLAGYAVLAQNPMVIH